MKKVYKYRLLISVYYLFAIPIIPLIYIHYILGLGLGLVAGWYEPVKNSIIRKYKL